MAGRILLAIASMTIVTAANETSSAQRQETGFRVETDLFQAEEKEPFYQTVTLFRAGVAYDFPRDSGVITMVDPKRNRIVLLDEQNKRLARFDLTQLKQLVHGAMEGAKDVPGFLAVIEDAQNVHYDDNSVVVGKSVIKYDAELQTPDDRTIAAEYKECVDALTIFNAWRNPAALPFARLNLNEAVAAKQALPKEFVRTQYTSKQPQAVRCLLHANWRLSSSDRERIGKVGALLVSLPEVPQAEFFEKPSQVAATKTTLK